MKRTFTRHFSSSIVLIILFGFPFQGLFSQCPIAVNLGNDTILCPGANIVLDAGPGEVYIWDDPQVTTRYRTISAPGTYTVSVKIYNCTEFGQDQIVISPASTMSLNLVLPVRPLPYFCKGETADLTGEVSSPADVVKYEWSVTPVNTTLVTLDTSKLVSLTITDKNGCTWTNTREVEFQYPYEKDSIKLATYDPTEDKSIVIYSKSLNRRTRSYILYNGYTETDSLTTIPFTGSNLVVDASSNPHVRPSYYNLRLIDSCLNRSSFALEKTHKTIFLKVIRKTDGTTSLEWDRYIGFRYFFFYIKRGTTPTNMVTLDSVKYIPLVDRYSFTDGTKHSENFYYQILVKTPDTVRIENPGKKAQAGPFVHSASNLEDNRLQGTGVRDLTYLDTNLRVYPNPYHGSTIIRYRIDSRADVSIRIFSVTGQQVAILEEGIRETGNYEIPFSASEYGLPPGMYYVRYTIRGTGTITRKLVEQ